MVRGEAMFKARQPPTSSTSIRLEKLKPKEIGRGSWHVSGVKQDDTWKAGLRVLEEHVSTCVQANNSLLDFPRRKNKTPVLLKEGLIAKLLNRERVIKDCHKGDVSAMQGDIKHLTLRQLMRLRSSNLDFVDRSLGDTHASFIEMLDQMLFDLLGQAALIAGGVEYCENAVETRQLGQQFLMVTGIVGAIKVGPTTSQPYSWWACWLGDKRVFFHVSDFICGASFPAGEGVMEIDDASKRDVSQQVQLDWMTRPVVDESELQARKFSTGTAGLTAMTFRSDVLQRARMKLRIVTCFKAPTSSQSPSE